MANHDLTVPLTVGTGIPFSQVPGGVDGSPERAVLTIAPAFQFQREDDTVGWRVPVPYETTDPEFTISGMAELDKDGNKVTWELRIQFLARRGTYLHSTTVLFQIPDGAPTAISYPSGITLVQEVQPPEFGPTWAEQAKADAEAAEVSRLAAVAAQGAAVTAQAAAVAAKVAAEAVPLTNDGIIAGRINTAGSATDVALKSVLNDASIAILALARTKALYSGNRFAVIGDSIPWGYPGGKNAWIDYAGLFSNGRLQRIRNAGVSADHTSDVLGRLDADVISKGFVDACIVACGINDILGTDSFALTTGNLTAIYNQLEAAGIRPVLWTVLANSNTTPTQKAAIVTLNAWIRTYAASHFYDCIDLYDLSRDPATGGMYASWTADGTHPGLAYHIIGKAVAAYLSPKLPALKSGLVSSAAERRSLIDNALMLVDTNSDGIADGWAGSFGSGFTHAIQTPAVGTDVVGNWQTVTMATGATSRRLEWTTAVTRLPLGLAFASPGDRIGYRQRVVLSPGADAAGASVFATVEGANVHAAAASLSYPVDGIAYGEFTIPTGFTGRVGVVLTTGNGAGFYGIAQPTFENLTRLGSAVAASTAPVTPPPGDGLSGTTINGVVASDSFTRTTADLVGTWPTTARTGTVWAGQTGRLSCNGARAISAGGAGNLVYLDVQATGDTTVSETIRLSTQETVTKTSRLYVKYVDANNYAMLNMATSSTEAITVRVGLAGVQRTVLTFAGTTLPDNTAPTDYAVSFSIIGTAISATVNGVTLSGTLTTAEVAALASSSKVGITTDSTNHEFDNFVVTVNGTYV